MLYVKKSQLPKAGKGLFVANDIKKGEINIQDLEIQKRKLIDLFGFCFDSHT